MCHLPLRLDRQTFIQTKEKRKMIQINKTNEVVDITTDTTGIQNIIRDCYELLYQQTR